jgi:tetratricopeptide (TPR) repeat protein
MLRRYRRGLAFLLGFAAVTAGICPFARGVEPPPSVSALNSEGIRALNAGDLGRALRDFLAAYHTDPTDADVAFNLGLTYFRLGKYEEAVAPLRCAVSVNDPPDKVLYILGVSLYQLGDFDAATEQLEILHRRNSQHQDEILYLLEESYRRGKKPQHAKECFAELESKYRNSCFFHKLMGSAYSEQGQDDQALAEFKQAVAANPFISDVHRDIGIIYLNRREVDDASEWFREELALNPCDPRSHYYLGEIARKATQLPTAEAEYKRAIACDANYAESHLGMGLLLVAEHLDLRALKEFRETVRLQPDNSQAHYQLARCLQRVGKAHEAEIELATVKRLEALENEKAAAKLR